MPYCYWEMLLQSTRYLFAKHWVRGAVRWRELIVFELLFPLHHDRRATMRDSASPSSTDKDRGPKAVPNVEAQHHKEATLALPRSKSADCLRIGDATTSHSTFDCISSGGGTALGSRSYRWAVVWPLCVLNGSSIYMRSLRAAQRRCSMVVSMFVRRLKVIDSLSSLISHHHVGCWILISLINIINLAGYTFNYTYY